MSTHPYIPWYVDDYDAATSHLTLEEDGVYSRLLRLAWRTPGCSLPNDHAWIARKIRLPLGDIERVLEPVLAEFFALQRGRLVQRRLKREYDDISRKKTARKLAGKKGGDAKARNNNDKSASNASVLPSDTRAFHTHTQNQIYSVVPSNEETTGGEPPSFDPDKKAWQEAVDLLVANGVKASDARSFFGKLLSANGLQARDLLAAINEAYANRTGDPKSWLAGAAKTRSRKPAPAETLPSGRRKYVGYV